MVWVNQKGKGKGAFYSPHCHIYRFHLHTSVRTYTHTHTHTHTRRHTLTPIFTTRTGTHNTPLTILLAPNRFSHFTLQRQGKHWSRTESDINVSKNRWTNIGGRFITEDFNKNWRRMNWFWFKGGCYKEQFIRMARVRCIIFRLLSGSTV